MVKNYNYKGQPLTESIKDLKFIIEKSENIIPELESAMKQLIAEDKSKGYLFLHNYTEKCLLLTSSVLELKPCIKNSQFDINYVNRMKSIGEESADLENQIRQDWIRKRGHKEGFKTIIVRDEKHKSIYEACQNYFESVKVIRKIADGLKDYMPAKTDKSTYEIENKYIQIKNIPPGTKWENITLELRSEDEVAIKINKKNNIKNYNELGFQKGKSKTPNKEWWFLVFIMANQGVLPQKRAEDIDDIEQMKEAKKSRDIIYQHIKNLRVILINMFGIEDDPIPFIKWERHEDEKSGKDKWKKINEYRAKFLVKDSSCGGDGIKISKEVIGKIRKNTDLSFEEFRSKNKKNLNKSKDDNDIEEDDDIKENMEKQSREE